jgi:3'-phosphoadenosine 5'-phosphosulfate sulfotransferase
MVNPISIAQLLASARLACVHLDPKFAFADAKGLSWSAAPNTCWNGVTTVPKGVFWERLVCCPVGGTTEPLMARPTELSRERDHRGRIRGPEGRLRDDKPGGEMTHGAPSDTWEDDNLWPQVQMAAGGRKLADARESAAEDGGPMLDGFADTGRKLMGKQQAKASAKIPWIEPAEPALSDEQLAATGARRLADVQDTAAENGVDPFAEEVVGGRRRLADVREVAAENGDDPFGVEVVGGRRLADVQDTAAENGADPFAEEVLGGRRRLTDVREVAAENGDDPFEVKVVGGRRRLADVREVAAENGDDPFEVVGGRRLADVQDTAAENGVDPFAEEGLGGRRRLADVQDTAAENGVDPFAEEGLGGRRRLADVREVAAENGDDPFKVEEAGGRRLTDVREVAAEDGVPTFGQEVVGGLRRLFTFRPASGRLLHLDGPRDTWDMSDARDLKQLGGRRVLRERVAW